MYMSHKAGQQRRDKNRRQRKKATHIARAVALPQGQSPQPPSSHQAESAPQLLQRLADTLNMMDIHGITAQLTDGAVITEYGYVFWFGHDEETPWQVRTRRLTEFSPAEPLSDDLT
jgi:hypothetical protein